MVISAIYMRSISEKRRSAAAIKSLLDMMAENRGSASPSSVYTMQGVYQSSYVNQAEEEIPSGTIHKPRGQKMVVKWTKYRPKLGLDLT